MNNINLICPSCSSLMKSRLLLKDARYLCTNVDCAIEYPIVSGIPVLLDTTKRDFHGILENARGKDGKLC
jgi:uncharacterized protein YbaR (Trm112 family)